jgi:hypothetical protein
MNRANLVPPEEIRNNPQAVFYLNPHECLRASIVATRRRPVLRLERCKITSAGLIRTGQCFEVAQRRAKALLKLIDDVAGGGDD